MWGGGGGGGLKDRSSKPPTPISNLQDYTGIRSSDMFQKRWRVFTDDGFGVVAGDIVPLDAVLVDVVEDAQAGLSCVVDVEFCVIRLWHLFVTSGAPWLIAPASWFLVGGS